MFAPKSSDCVVRRTRGKGRGVFGASTGLHFISIFDGKELLASRAIPAHTVIEIDPVLLFTRDEYEAHGKHTILDQYTFKWRGGQMALALGLGTATI
jgi:tRNA-specific adenosine deaminase 3